MLSFLRLMRALLTLITAEATQVMATPNRALAIMALHHIIDQGHNTDRILVTIRDLVIIHDLATIHGLVTIRDLVIIHDPVTIHGLVINHGRIRHDTAKF